MSLTDYIIAKQLGMRPETIASRPIVRRRGTCANCGRPLSYDQSGNYTHASNGAANCERAV